MRYRNSGRAEIIIINLTRRRIPPARLIKRTILRVLKSEKREGRSLSVAYVGGARIKRLNRIYRKKDAATDVLAFGIKGGKRLKGEDGYLGDIVISLDAAKERAKRFGYTKNKELELYLIHGVLHLLGYDDRTEHDLRKMRRKEERLMA